MSLTAMSWRDFDKTRALLLVRTLSIINIFSSYKHVSIIALQFTQYIVSSQ